MPGPAPSPQPWEAVSAADFHTRATHDRETILRMEREGRSRDEIAAVTGSSRNIISMIVSEARKRGEDLPKRKGGRS